MKNLVNSWQERLQLISVIVSFHIMVVLPSLRHFTFVDHILRYNRSSHAGQHETNCQWKRPESDRKQCIAGIERLPSRGVGSTRLCLYVL
jgi:hypothetical protein